MMKQRYLLALCGVVCLLGMRAFSQADIVPFQAMPLTARAEETAELKTCGENLTWNYDSDTYTLTIEGTGNMKNFGYRGGSPWYGLEFQKVILPEGITSIGSYAFTDCKELTEIDIPEGVTNISNYAFAYCEGLTKVNIPDSVKSIGDDCFCECGSLQFVNLPKNLKKMGNSVFNECTALTSIEIPEGVTEIEANAFSACESLTSVKFPDTVEKIYRYAFANCINLTNVTLPETMEQIDDYVFCNCKSLTSITLPQNLKTIGKASFASTALESLTIPEGVTAIKENAFAGCKNLREIDFPDSIETIEVDTFALTPWISARKEESPFVIVNHILIDGTNCTGDVVIPETVTSISKNAFSETEITSVDVPESVTKINDSAFNQCQNLTSITIRNPYCQVNYLGNFMIWTTTTIYGYPHSLIENYAKKKKLDFVPLEEECKVNYTYEIIPVLSSLNQYFYVRTNNPDPQSFRFADKETTYAKDSVISVKTTAFSDVEYDDFKTLRVNGGYLFYSNTTDGGEVALQVHNFDTWEEIGISYTLPELYDGADYLIHTYATKDDFFANMDAVQEGLAENAVYSGSYIRGEIFQLGDFWKVMLSPHIDHHFYINSPYYYKNNTRLFVTDVYPYCCDSLGFPTMMARVAKRLESSSSYVWNSESHALIDVTFGETTKTYGGQGRNEGQAITKNDILHLFDFAQESYTLDYFHEWLDKYSALEIEDDIPRKNALTWAEIANTAGSGTWARLDGGYAYLYLKDGKNYYFANEFGVGNSIYWRGSLGYGCDSWVDGRYIDEHEKYVPDATFAEHPESNIILKQSAFPVINSSNPAKIQEVAKTVRYVYNPTENIWEADSDAISSEDYQKIMSMVENGSLDEKYLHRLQLTPEEVQELHVDRNTSTPPESGLVFDGTVKPASKFVNDTVFENGDISQNGTLETEDITIMQKYLHCQNPVNEEQAFIADLNQDGMLNVIDLALLKKQLLPDKSFENNPVAFLQDYLHRLHSMTEEQSRLLDKNQDGTVNVIDLALLKQSVLQST